MATATLVGRLVDRGWMRFDDPMRAYLPEVPHTGVELRHLLSHTSGLPAWIPLWQRIRERLRGTSAEVLERVPIAVRQRLARELVVARFRSSDRSAQSAVYSDLSFLLLGFALEEVLRLSAGSRGRGARFPADGHRVRRFIAAFRAGVPAARRGGADRGLPLAQARASGRSARRQHLGDGRLCRSCGGRSATCARC